ncbi:transmembrane protein 26-like isoform 1-T2 [Menidia menidia]
MSLFTFLSAIITRALFVLLALVGVFRVIWVKKDGMYWLLTIIFLPLVVEMIITLKRRQGQDYKWFSPPIFLFLISIIPSIWILELHHRHGLVSDPECQSLDSWDSLRKLISQNKTLGNQTNNDYLKTFQNVFSAVCSNEWILALHQLVLILLIFGKWLLPIGGGVSKGELSEILLTFVGTGADILEFNSETLNDIKDRRHHVVYIILGVWTWSMLQFPIHPSAANSAGENEEREDTHEDSWCASHISDIWSIVQALLIQDGPFLVVRLTVMTYYRVFNQMLAFFAFKNFLVFILNLYKLAVLSQHCRSCRHDPVRASDVP